jgi:hypothetical protein
MHVDRYTKIVQRFRELGIAGNEDGGLLRFVAVPLAFMASRFAPAVRTIK